MGGYAVARPKRANGDRYRKRQRRKVDFRGYDSGHLTSFLLIFGMFRTLARPERPFRPPRSGGLYYRLSRSERPPADCAARRVWFCSIGVGLLWEGGTGNGAAKWIPRRSHRAASAPIKSSPSGFCASRSCRHRSFSCRTAERSLRSDPIRNAFLIRRESLGLIQGGSGLALLLLKKRRSKWWSFPQFLVLAWSCAS